MEIRTKEAGEMTDDTILLPECPTCEHYQEIQDIKTERIKELQKQLDVAKDALDDIGFNECGFIPNNVSDEMPAMLREIIKQMGDTAREALEKLK